MKKKPGRLLLIMIILSVQISDAFVEHRISFDLLMRGCLFITDPEQQVVNAFTDQAFDILPDGGQSRNGITCTNALKGRIR